MCAVRLLCGNADTGNAQLFLSCLQTSLGFIPVLLGMNISTCVGEGELGETSEVPEKEGRKGYGKPRTGVLVLVELAPVSALQGEKVEERERGRGVRLPLDMVLCQFSRLSLIGGVYNYGCG